MQDILITHQMIQGAVSIETVRDGLKPWRLPYKELALYPPDDALPLKAEQLAGVRLIFATDSPIIELTVQPESSVEGDKRIFDLTVGSELVQSRRLPDGKDVVRFENLGEEMRPVEIWLPQFFPCVLKKLRVADDTNVAPVQDERPRWIAYGSSITHCRAAHSPARTWPATVAREQDLNLTCLGYGGNCHLEPMVAMMIRDLPADVITLKLGINVQGASSLSDRTFRAAIIGFVRIIREKHPNTPIGVISPIISPPRENTPNLVGMSLRLMREQVEEAVQRLREAGDSNLYYFSGLDAFGKAQVSHLPDELHPDGDGYEILGQNISDMIFSQPPFQL